MKRKILSLLMVGIMLCCSIVYTIAPVSAETNDALIVENNIPLRLYYDEEASHDVNGAFENLDYVKSTGAGAITANVNDDWERWSIPIGNGHFGVNLFGRTNTERIQITDKTMQNPYASWNTSLGGLNNFSETYIDFGHTNSEVTNYSRELDLKTAISTVKYTYNGVNYEREYFASYPDNALVIKLSSSSDGALSFVLRPTVPYEQEYAKTEGDGASKTGTVTSTVEDGVGLINLNGKMGYYDVDFVGLYRVYTDGTGTVAATTTTNADGDTDGTITVTGTKTAYIVVTLGTDYVLSPEIFTSSDSAKPTFNTGYDDAYAVVNGRMEAVIAHLNGTTAQWYEILKSRHLSDYQNLFGRVTLDLDCNESDFELTTDELLANYKNGSGSTYLEVLYFQYGRYLLIASSRDGALPANLQGTWNKYNFSPWSSGYWHNINVQMNYWPAFSTNLAETFSAYSDYNSAYMTQAEAYADAQVKKYTPELDGVDGGNGWVIGTGCKPFSIDTSRSSGDIGFTTQLFWDYYRYTGDKKYLEEKIYPVLASAARYITKCVELQEDGTYLVVDSPSPEQFAPGTQAWYYTDGPAYAQSSAYMNNYYLLEVAKELGIDLTNESLLSQEEYKILKTVLTQIDKYDPIVVGLSGQVKEFREEEYYGDIGEYNHRHISQLIGLYPGEIINSTTPAWLDAAKVTLTERGDNATGWGVAHRLNLWARTKDGNRTHKLVEQLLKSNTATNLWDLHPPFQIDGNLGGTAGIAEMLLQSHEGYIAPLSAIPDNWATGSYTGLKARGNFEVAARWENGRAKTFNIKSINGNKASVGYFGIENAKVVKASDGSTVNFSVTDKDVITFDTVAGETYIISNLGTQTKLAAPAKAEAERNLLDPVAISWSEVSGAVSYNVYVAADSAPVYTLIANTKNTSYMYAPVDANINSRFTFKIAPVNAEGVEGNGAICYQNPVDVELEVNSYTACIVGDTELQVTINASAVADTYKLWKKTSGAAEYTLFAESDYPVIVDTAYSNTATYGISVTGLYGGETEITQITKFTTADGGNNEDLPTYYRNFLTDYTFVGADDALQHVLYNMGYSRLTDGKHKVGTDHQTYRFAAKDEAGSYMDGTITFDKEFFLDELRLYDYNQSSSTSTRAGETMDVYIVQDGEWIKAKSFASKEELIAARRLDSVTGTYYTAVDLDGCRATAIRVVCKNITSTQGVTLFEIECSGLYIPTPAVADATNVISGLQPEAYEVNEKLYPSYGVDKLTDNDYGVHSGRLAVYDAENSSLSVTYDLDKTYFLNEVRVYDHYTTSTSATANDSQSRSSETTVEVYRDGKWVTVIDKVPLWLNRSELVQDDNGKYATLALDCERSEKVRFTFKNTINAHGISIYEIQCYGGVAAFEDTESNAFDNYISITQTGADGIYSSSYKLENALDGDMSTRFAVKGSTVSDFYVEVDLGVEKPLFNLTIYDYGDSTDKVDGILTTRSDDTYVELYTNGSWLRVADNVELDITDHITEFYLMGITASKIRIGFSTPEFTSGETYHHASVYEMTCTTTSNAPDRKELLAAYKALCDLGLDGINEYNEQMTLFKSYITDTDADQSEIDAYTLEMTEFLSNGLTEGVFVNSKTYAALITSDVSGTYKIIFASYNSDNKMLSMKTADVILSGGSVKINAPDDFGVTGASTVKIMVWADISSTLRPIFDMGLTTITN